MVGTETYDLTYSDMFNYYEDLVEDKKDGGSRPQKKGEKKVSFVRSVAGEGGPMVIFDTGADISVLPMSYREVGFPLERVTALRDVHGGQMTNSSVRQAVIELEDEEGHMVALSNVKEPSLQEVGRSKEKEMYA